MWNSILDDIKHRLQLKTENELSHNLNISPSILGHIRSGIRRPSVDVACKLIDREGFVLTRDLFLALLPEKAQKAFIESEQRRMSDSFAAAESERMYSSIIDEAGEIDWNKALDTLKDRLALQTEKQLAAAIETSPTALGYVRSGSRPLTSNSKMRLLLSLGITLNKQALEKVVSPELGAAIRDDRLPLKGIFG